MQNIKELIESLADNYEQMKAGNMDINKGRELSNCASRIIQSLKVELEYQTLIGTKTDIDFLT